MIFVSWQDGPQPGVLCPVETSRSLKRQQVEALPRGSGQVWTRASSCWHRRRIVIRRLWDDLPPHARVPRRRVETKGIGTDGKQVASVEPREYALRPMLVHGIGLGGGGLRMSLAERQLC